MPVLTRQLYLLKAGKVDLNIVSTQKEVASIMVIVIIIKTKADFGLHSEALKNSLREEQLTK